MTKVMPDKSFRAVDLPDSICDDAESLVRLRRLALAIVIAVCAAPLSGADIVTIAGNGREALSGDGGPAKRAAIGQPFGLTIGPDAALCVCSVANHVIRRIDLSTGLISTVAGSGEKGYAGDGGPATDARLNEPYEVRFDADGNMFFVEMQNFIVRRVDAKTKTISTIAGTGHRGYSGDGGPAVQARLAIPHSIVLDNAHHLDICDIGNHRIRQVDLLSGTISTLCGTGKRAATPDGAPLAGTPLNGPRTLAFDERNSLYLALREGNACYRIDLREQRIHHLAGTGQKGYSGDGQEARTARLNGPKGIAVGPHGDVYLADTENHAIRVIRDGRIETVIGDGQRGDGPDGDPHHCRLARPHGVFIDGQGTIYVGDSDNHRIRMLRSQ
jgi:streptogramin lyase